VSIKELVKLPTQMKAVLSVTLPTVSVADVKNGLEYFWSFD